LIETLYFNFTAVRRQLLGLETAAYAMDEMSFINWTETDGGERISQPDPIIYIEDVCADVKSLTIRVKAEPLPDVYAVFYTTAEDETFSEEKMVMLTPVTGEDTVELDGFIYALRVDPGELGGLVLQNVSFTINEARWDISPARIIAMLGIYWGARFLMKLQRTPDYGLDTANIPKQGGEGDGE